MRIECVPDDEEDISRTVLGLKERVGPGGFVFTSGGIGATHDDVTYSAIAAAFGTSKPPNLGPASCAACEPTFNFTYSPGINRHHSCCASFPMLH